MSVKVRASRVAQGGESRKGEGTPASSNVTKGNQRKHNLPYLTMLTTDV
jgi:hypothetical protein